MVVGFLAGVLVGRICLSVGNLLPVERYQNWQYSRSPRSGISKLWYQAWVTHYGTFPVSEIEGSYLILERDPQGNPLREECAYRLNGSALPAAWWAISVYGRRGLWRPNQSGKTSLTSQSMPVENWQVEVRSQLSQGPQLVTQGAGSFRLMLRLFAPTSSIAAMSFPHLERLGCGQ